VRVSDVGKGDIFLVDDNPNNLTLLYGILKTAGYQVRVASSGRRALDTIGAYPPELIMLDIQMPEMDGYEATRQIKAIAPDLPIIAQTAHAFNEEREKCLAAGMIGHLAKPIDPQALLELVREHWPARIPG